MTTVNLDRWIIGCALQAHCMRTDTVQIFISLMVRQEDFFARDGLEKAQKCEEASHERTSR